MPYLDLFSFKTDMTRLACFTALFNLLFWGLFFAWLDRMVNSPDREPSKAEKPRLLTKLKKRCFGYGNKVIVIVIVVDQLIQLENTSSAKVHAGFLWILLLDGLGDWNLAGHLELPVATHLKISPLDFEHIRTSYTVPVSTCILATRYTFKWFECHSCRNAEKIVEIKSSHHPSHVPSFSHLRTNENHLQLNTIHCCGAPTSWIQLGHFYQGSRDSTPTKARLVCSRRSSRRRRRRQRSKNPM